MRFNDKTKEQLIEELAKLRKRTSELEKLEDRRRKAEKILRSVADISDRTGIKYFQSIAAFIAGELGTEYAIIGKLDAERNMVKTIAAYGRGKIIDDIEYDLHGTPCNNVMGKQACFYPDKIQDSFPEDTLLADMKAESYAGIPLFASDGQPLGIIVTLGCKPMKRDERARCISLLQIFAARVSSELERKEAEDGIKKIKYSLAKAQQIAKIGNWDWNIVTNKLWWSDEIYRIFGLARREFSATYEAFLNTVHTDDRELVETSVDKALYEKKHYSIDHRIVLPDGSEKIVHEEAEVTYDEMDRPVRMIGTVQDVTELKEMEGELQKSKQELERRVEERTAELKSAVDLLQNEIAERRKAEEKVRKSLIEKEVLLKEIHHRVKNNLAVVSSLLRLQSAKARDEHYREMFNDSVNRINTMASVHEKLYQSDDLTKILFSTYIKDMVNDIFASYGLSPRVKLITDIEQITLGIDASIPCGLIINELITNSMKYAFPEGREGEIRVCIHAHDKGYIQLAVSDNGVGMPEGLDFRNTDSLGLNLVKDLVGQLQGKIELSRENGTGYKITFKQVTD